MVAAIGVAVVGAGPYGLSVAAHLSALGLKPRVFGRPMETWLSYMPEGMVLKSEGSAMDLSDPEGRYTFGAFCAERGIDYRRMGWPVPVDIFAAYGKAFQERFVPQVEASDVRSIERTEQGFALVLETGEELVARNVIMATGIRPFARVPETLGQIPDHLATHSSQHGEMSHFAGRHVAVLGGGASAMDVAASLHRAGAKATVVTRRSVIRFYSPSSFRSVRDRLLAPMTPLGPGWKKFLCVKAPGLFRLLPAALRGRILHRYLGPSPAWSVRDIIDTHVDVRTHTALTAAVVEDGRVALTLDGPVQAAETLLVDHVIAATGYGVDVARVPALDAPLRGALRCSGQVPELSRNFETSVPGLFFVGTPSATSFGPMLRFVCGSAFAATRVARRIARSEGALRREGTRSPLVVWRPASRPAQM